MTERPCTSLRVLAVNSGSSSLKFKLTEISQAASGVRPDSIVVRYDGSVREIGGTATLSLGAGGKSLVEAERAVPTHAEAAQWMLQALEKAAREGADLLRIDAVGHRVVHGGDRFRQSVRITSAVLEGIQELAELAPLHNPACLAGIRGAQTVLGEELPMVAVFDTAFHQAMPPRAATYAIPRELAAEHGIKRYGFHGIAHASLAASYAARVGRPLEEVRVITLHLGNGCSAAAIEGGRSVDTSMGFTPLEGLVMGTRSGDVDPAVVGYLCRRQKVSAGEVERWLNERSGLLGVSGLSHDMRRLLEAEERGGDPRAALAIDLFCYRARKYVGAYLAALGGAEAVIFGGGIGERAPAIRARICDGMGWCGLRLDARRNAAAVDPAPRDAVRVSAAEAALAVYVAGVDEEAEIAQATARCLLFPGA